MAENMRQNCYADDLKLTSDEASRLKTAFEDQEFLKLFQEYVEDVNSAESRKSYEEAIVSMEKERGFDVTFVHPVPCYVMKFHNDGMKIFVNICKNQYVREPSSERKNSGTEWKIPVVLSKPREDLDRKQSKCTAVDVMFHPNTMDLAARNPRFKNIVEDTALTTIEEKFGFRLRGKPAAYPKMKYKGKAPSVVLRHFVNQNSVCEPVEDYLKRLLSSTKPSKDQPLPAAQKATVPKYSLKYRNIVDMQDFSLMGYTDKTAPKEIILEVQLPEVVRASEVQLDVSQKKLELKSSPGASHAYNLELELSYAVNENSGCAKFDKTKKVLNVKLPVKDRGIPNSFYNEKDTNERDNL